MQRQSLLEGHRSKELKLAVVVNKLFSGLAGVEVPRCRGADAGVCLLVVVENLAGLAQQGLEVLFLSRKHLLQWLDAVLRHVLG